MLNFMLNMLGFRRAQLFSTLFLALENWEFQLHRRGKHLAPADLPLKPLFCSSF